MARRVTCYRAYGLLISTDVALPLAAVTEPEADVRCVEDRALPLSGPVLDRRAESVIAWYGDPDDPWYVATEVDGGFHISFRGTAEFAVSRDASVVRWREHPTADAGMIPVLLGGTVLAFLLILRGDLTLHASAVAVGGRALAFAGHSGMGKTTTAALAVACGAAAITDDVLRVCASVPPLCCGSGGELRLRRESQEIHQDLLGAAMVSETGDGRILVEPTTRHHGWVELGAIILPRPTRDADSVNLERLPPGSALLQLTSFPRVYALSHEAIVQQQFEQLAAVCSSVPVYIADLPWGPPFDPATFAEIVAQVT